MIAWLIAIGTAVPLCVFSLECLVGTRPSPPTDAPGTAPPFTVLIPAHDEAGGIAATIGAVMQQLRPMDRIVVVADNCSDDTEAVSRRAGATVYRRDDPTRIGKGYALAFGRDKLRADPPRVVIVLDADCTPAAGALHRLAATADHTHSAVQARYILGCAADAAPIVRISTFAFLIKNLIRQRGLRRLGGGALLQGSGMAFPWSIFAAAPLATASIVEDLRLGLDFVLSGSRVMFEESAIVRGRAASEVATRTQRKRWEHGTMATAAAYLPSLIAAAWRGRPGLLLLAADLIVPPLALLVSLVALAGAATLLLALTGGGSGPFILIAAASLVFAGAIMRAWLAIGWTIAPLSSLLRLPAYIVWKQPIYWRLAAGRERAWVRTSRAP